MGNWFRFYLESKDLAADRLAKRSLSPCVPTWVAVGCNCPRLALAKTGCWTSDCPECRRRVSRRRTGAVMARLDRRPEKAPVVYTVFTVPPALREQYRHPRKWAE